MKENYQKEIAFLQKSVFSKIILALSITIIASYIPMLLPPIANIFEMGNIAITIVKFIAIISFLVFASNKMNSAKTKGVKLFWFSIIPTIIGITSSSIFIYYSLGSIVSVFIISSIYFIALYVFSKSTGMDFTKYGTIISISLFSIIIALIFNLIIGSSLLNTILSIIIIIIFSFSTLKDSQEMIKFVEKNENYEYEKVFEDASYSFAISLYLDFINIFINLLDLFGR